MRSARQKLLNMQKDLIKQPDYIPRSVIENIQRMIAEALSSITQSQIAERENSVIQLEEGYEQRYKELTEENFILVAMLQSAFVRYSERFAEIAAETMSKHLKIKNSGVKQAGFYVLVGASMPNVLVETGYLSNRQEERVLRSKEGQQKIAEALFESIKEYKRIYEETLQDGRSSF